MCKVICTPYLLLDIDFVWLFYREARLLVQVMVQIDIQHKDSKAPKLTLCLM